MGTYVFVGDSVTAAGRVPSRPDDLGRGWVADVAGRLRQADRRSRVLNLGVSGNRAADVRDRVVADLASAGGDVPGAVVTLAVGINDVRRAHLDGVPFDVRVFARTYASVLPRVLATVPGGGARLLLVEPVLAPLDRAQKGWSDHVDQVCDYVGHLAAAEGAALVRVRRTFARAEAAEVTKDGIHPTAAGHRLIADAWWRAAGEVPGLLPAGTVRLTAAGAPGSSGGGPDGSPDGSEQARPRWWDRLRLRLTGG